MKLNKKHETTRNLRVIYTDPDRLELGKQLAGAYQDLSQTNTDLDSIKTSFKAKIAAHEANIADLSTKVANGWRIEEVKCVFEMDTPKKLHKTLRRLDTQEIVEVSEMTQADIQGELALEEEKASAVAGVAGDGNVKVDADK